jgi:hypothetical protein
MQSNERFFRVEHHVTRFDTPPMAFCKTQLQVRSGDVLRGKEPERARSGIYGPCWTFELKKRANRGLVEVYVQVRQPRPRESGAVLFVAEPGCEAEAAEKARETRGFAQAEFELLPNFVFCSGALTARQKAFEGECPFAGLLRDCVMPRRAWRGRGDHCAYAQNRALTAETAIGGIEKRILLEYAPRSFGAELAQLAEKRRQGADREFDLDFAVALSCSARHSPASIRGGEAGRMNQRTATARKIIEIDVVNQFAVS